LPAGTTVNRSDAFNYHQVGFFSGKVYDPSAGYAVPANPATPFTPAPYILGYDAYLNTAFGTTRDDVNTVRVTAITAT
jgi:hypothetical protein